MKKSILLFISLLFYSLCYCQSADSTSTKYTSIDQLAFMQGQWKGEGWIMMGGRDKKTFVQQELIQPKAGGTVLMIDGLGFSKDSLPKKHIIHDAFGVIAYDDSLKTVTMVSYSTAGVKQETEMVPTGEKTLQWSFKDERGGTIRFSEDFSQEGIWKEKGEYSFDGKNWFQFFTMELHKQDEE